jgi:hypothetical protein
MIGYSSSDMKRIVEMPVIQRPNQAWADHYSDTALRPDAPANPDGTPFKLKLEQAWALYYYRQHGGCLVPITVGGGKTLTGLIIAQAAFWERGHAKALLLIPNDANIQFIEQDIPYYKKRARLDFRWHLIAKKSASMRMKIAASGEPGLYVMNYSQLSNADSVELLALISPTVIVADEAHALANARAARTKRLFHTLTELQKKISSEGRRIEYVFMSGTLTRKHPTDLHKPAVLALGPMAPIPIQYNIAKDWDQQLSVDNTQFTVDASMTPLIMWARNFFPAEHNILQNNVVGARRAFALRMRHSPGVVSSIEGSTDASILIEDTNSPIVPSDPKEYQRLQHYIEQVETYGMKPNGDLVPTPMHIFKEKSELTAGIYNDQYWPRPDEIQRQRGISEQHALDILARSQDWLREEQTLYGLMFQFTKHSKIGLDTPRDIGRAITRGLTQGMPPELVAQWLKLHALDFPERVERKKRAVRVSDFKLQAVVKAVMARPKDEGAIVWTYNTGVREWLVELFRLNGEEAIEGPPGSDDAKRLIIDPANKHRVFVVSVTAFSQILNLQHFGLNYYAQWPRQAKIMEQSLGRTHRSGQQRDEVTAYTFLQTSIDHEIMGACLVDATYAHQIMGSPQKIVIARYNPPPELPPLEMLYERVPNIEKLPPEVAKEYLRKFGGRHE